MTDRSPRPGSKSPKDCANLKELRKEIDQLDREIVALLAARAGYVARAAEIKESRAAIVDDARIEQVIAHVRSAAAARRVDPDLMEAIYRAMIAAFIAFEERAFEVDKKN
jgi:isochorismate pyruvate lyase